MTEAFVPLMPATAGSRETGFTALPLRGLSATVSSAFATPHAAGAACVEPVITLQRTGETVSGLRVECGCGKAIDLTFVY